MHGSDHALESLWWAAWEGSVEGTDVRFAVRAPFPGFRDAFDALLVVSVGSLDAAALAT